MQFVELVLQGVRNFSQVFRLPFGPGVTVLVGGAGTGKSTLVEVLLRLLDPEPLENEANDLASQGADASRAALLLSDDRGGVYRLVRDFAKGSMVLSRRDISTGQFVNVSSSPAEIRQYLGGEVHLPQRDLWEELYLSRAASLPSARPAAPAPPAVTARAAAPLEPALAPAVSPPPAAAARGFRGYQGTVDEPEPLPDDPEEIRRQMEALQRDLKLAREVDDLQFELDGLRRQLFELEQKTRSVADAERRAEELERQRAAGGEFKQLPEDFERRVRDFISARQRRERDLARLEEEREQWEKRLQQQKPAPLRRNRLFLGGMLLGLLALAVGISGFFLDESLRWVALLDLLGFAVALFSALRHIDAGEASARAASRLQLIEQRKKKIEQEFDIGTAVVRKTMAELQVESPEAILEQYARVAELKAQAEAARAEVKKLKSDPSLQAAAESERQLRKRVDELEAKLAGASGLMMGPQEMERRLRLLEEKLQGRSTTPAAGQETGEVAGAEAGAADDFMLGGPPAAVVGGRPPASLAPAAAEPEAAPPVAGPLELLMRCADDVFLQERESIEAALAPRASQILAVFSEGTWRQLAFGPGGRLEVTSASASQTFQQLPPASQDLVYLALKIAIQEKACQRQKVPLLFDEPFERLPGRLQTLLGRTVAYLGKLTQVVFLTRDETWAQFGTTNLRLG